jgi:hypothetical protein
MAHVETNRGVRLRSTAVPLSALLLAACTNMSSEVSGPEHKGQIMLALATPAGTNVSSFSWQVTSSTNQVLSSGTSGGVVPGVDPSVILGLPASVGDRVSMDVTTSAGVHCTGISNPFDVVAGQTNSVNVNVNCDSARMDGGAGSVVVTGVLVAGDNCPSVGGWTLSPQSAAANGGTIAVSVTALDADPGDTLTYAWSATAGTFLGASQATTTYTCAAAGDQTLSVVISDSHMPSACTITATFPAVSCL